MLKVRKEHHGFLQEQLVPHPPTLGFPQGENPKQCTTWDCTKEKVWGVEDVQNPLSTEDLYRC